KRMTQCIGVQSLPRGGSRGIYHCVPRGIPRSCRVVAIVREYDLGFYSRQLVTFPHSDNVVVVLAGKRDTKCNEVFSRHSLTQVDTKAQGCSLVASSPFQSHSAQDARISCSTFSQ